MSEREFPKVEFKAVAVLETGRWKPVSGRVIKALLDPLELPAAEYKELFAAVRRGTSTLFGRRMIASHYADYPKSRDLLISISKGAARLGDQLERLNVEFQVALEFMLSEKSNPASLLRIKRDLAQLTGTAKLAREVLAPRREGAHGDQALREVVELLLPAIEKSLGEPIGASYKTGSLDQARLYGPGGELLRSVLTSVDPRIADVTVVGILGKLRASAGEKTLRKRPRKAP